MNPNNILVSSDFQIWISDLFSEYVRPHQIRLFFSSALDYYYSTSIFSDSPFACYLGPEKFYASKFSAMSSGLAPSLDIFAFGCIVYEMIYRQPLLTLLTMQTFVRSGGLHQHKNDPDFSFYNNIVKICTSFNPEDRSKLFADLYPTLHETIFDKIDSKYLNIFDQNYYGQLQNYLTPETLKDAELKKVESLVVRRLVWIFGSLPALNDKRTVLEALKACNSKTDILRDFLVKLVCDDSHEYLSRKAVELLRFFPSQAISDISHLLLEHFPSISDDHIFLVTELASFLPKLPLDSSFDDVCGLSLSSLTFDVALSNPNFIPFLISPNEDASNDDAMFSILLHLISFLNTRPGDQHCVFKCLDRFIVPSLDDFLILDFVFPILQASLSSVTESTALHYLVKLLVNILSTQRDTKRLDLGSCLETLLSLTIKVYTVTKFLIVKLICLIIRSASELYFHAVLVPLIPLLAPESKRNKSLTLSVLGLVEDVFEFVNFESKCESALRSFVPRYVMLHIGFFARASPQSIEDYLLDANRRLLCQNVLGDKSALQRISPKLGICGVLLMEWRDPDGVELIRVHSNRLFSIVADKIKIWNLDNVQKRIRLKPIATYSFKNTKKIHDIAIVENGNVAIVSNGNSLVQLRILSTSSNIPEFSFEKTILELSTNSDYFFMLHYDPILQYVVAVSLFGHIYIYDLLAFTSRYTFAIPLHFGAPTAVLYHSAELIIIGTCLGNCVTIDINLGTFFSHKLMACSCITSLDFISRSLFVDILPKLPDTQKLVVVGSKGELTLALYLYDLGTSIFTLVLYFHTEKVPLDLRGNPPNNPGNYEGLLADLKAVAFGDPYISTKIFRIYGRFIVQILSNDDIIVWDLDVAKSTFLYHGCRPTGSLSSKRAIIESKMELCTYDFGFHPVKLLSDNPSNSDYPFYYRKSCNTITLGQKLSAEYIARSVDFRVCFEGIIDIRNFKVAEYPAPDDPMSNKLTNAYVIADSRGRFCIIK